jgi:hypothetical protein
MLYYCYTKKEGRTKMKKKTVNAVITQKMNKWLDSIDDVTVRKYIRSRVIVSGGAIASMLPKNSVKPLVSTMGI